MPLLKFTKLLPGNLRVKIVDAVELIVARYGNELMTSVALPPRFGKSAVIRLSALELFDGFPSIMTAPWADNVDQIRDIEKIKEMFKAYGIGNQCQFNTHRCHSLQTNNWWRLSEAVPTLITGTLGLFQNAANRKQFIDGISDIHQRSKRRVRVFIDEAHLVKEAKELGKFAKEITEAGGYVVLLTGTPVPGIPGFREECAQWEDIVRHIPKRKFIDGEWQYFIDHYEGEGRDITNIKADLNVTWQEAFDLGAMSKANAVWIDVDVNDEQTGEPLGLLSELATPALQGGLLKSVEESDEMMSKKALAALNRLKGMRAEPGCGSARMLVVTGRDEYIGKQDRSAEANRHAKRYEQKLREVAASLGMNLHIEIATGVDQNGEPDKTAARRIKDFRLGKIDVLIVKMMGIVGLDVPECKVLLYGSTLRKGPMAAQALSRVLTAWLRPAVLIMSQDQRMVELCDRLIKDQGGEWRETKLTLVGSDEIDQPEDKPTWIFSGARISGYSDQRGQKRVGDYELVLSLIKMKYQTTGLTDLQIIENYDLGGFPVSDEERASAQERQRETEELGIRDLDADLEKVTGSFGVQANQIVSRHVDYPSELWRLKVKELQQVAKRMCGVEGRRVSEIDDAALLQRLIDALEQAEIAVFGYGNRKTAS